MRIIYLITFFLFIGSFTEIESQKAKKFINKIEKGDKCGHAKAGQINYITNTDTINSYNVTIEINKSGGGLTSKKVTKTYKIKAGEKKYLGCSRTGDPGHTGITIRTWRIIGEKKL